LQFSFGGAISTLARQEGSPPRISIGASVWVFVSVGGLQGVCEDFPERSIQILQVTGGFQRNHGLGHPHRVEYKVSREAPLDIQQLSHEDLCESGVATGHLDQVHEGYRRDWKATSRADITWSRAS
jgi:hypothetical protein